MSDMLIDPIKKLLFFGQFLILHVGAHVIFYYSNKSTLIFLYLIRYLQYLSSYIFCTNLYSWTFKMLIWLIFFIYVSKIYSLNIPTGLLCDLKASPAMGVGLTPRFDWINPHLTQCHGDVTADPPLTDQVQYAYQIQIAPNYDTTFNKLIWDSNVMKTTKTANTFPLIQIPNHGFLKPAHTYLWRVRVWATQDCVSDWSVPAKFVSGLHVATGFDDSTKPIWAGDDSKYAFLRSVVSLNGKVSDAHIYVGAAQDGPMEKILGSYRLYVNGQVTTTGPGRGEVPYTDANHSVYDTIDITTSAQVAANADGKLLLALQGFHTSGKDAKQNKFDGRPMIGLPSYFKT